MNEMRRMKMRLLIAKARHHREMAAIIQTPQYPHMLKYEVDKVISEIDGANEAMNMAIELMEGWEND